MSSPASPAQGASALAAAGLMAAGVALLAAAWMLPINWRSLNPALLREAGAHTLGVAAYGQQLVEAEKIGPAGLVLTAARELSDPQAPQLAAALDALQRRQPAFVAWGGWDPFLDPLFNLRENTGRAASTPVLDFFITDRARDALRAYLGNSQSLGVQAVLRTGGITATTHFVPVNQAGGQALDAVVLLTALLYQGEHFSPPLQREIRALAKTALRRQDLGELEMFYLDLLSLGKRLDWGQLCGLLQSAGNTKTVAQFARLVRLAPGDLPLIYTAALFSQSADGVATYLIQYGKPGLADLRLAMGEGQGAVRELLRQQAPVNRHAGPAFAFAAILGLLHPKVLLALKYLAYFFGVYLCFRGLDRRLFAPPGGRAAGGKLPRMRSGLLAFVFAVLLVVLTEPYLLKATPPSEFRLRLVIPLLTNSSVPAAASPTASLHSTMDTSTLISIGVFAILQVITYLICLLKINEIERQNLPSLLKLRLIENEDNLFDSGLYVGMMGTATALVLQVLGVIEPNLLAAYSSNLFGLVCVAFVKIRHVRGYKRKLIIETQLPGPAAASPAPLAS